MNSIKVHLPPTTRMICTLAVVFWNYSEGYTQKEIPVPEFYGAYFVSDGKLISSKDAFEEKRLKTVGDRFSNKTGIKRLSGISLAANDYIVIYDKDASSLVNLLQLGKFKFVKELELGIWPNRQLYKMNYWIFEKNVPMNIGPVKGQPDLYRMVPKVALSDGVYAVYYNIESVMSSDKRLVLDFAVGKVASAAVETGVTINAERDALLKDVNKIASAATMYWRKPAALGGGMRTFVGVDFVKIGVDASNANGKFVMSNITTNQFTLMATGAKYGVVIVATITQQGISGTSTIKLP